MKAAVMAFMVAAPTASASQIVHMGLDEVVSWAGTIALVRVESVADTGCQDTRIMVYGIGVLEVFEGCVEASGPLECSYTQQMPFTFFDDEGDEVTEWPLVTGSGMETIVEPGDTVIVLLRSPAIAPGLMGSVIRMEPADSLQRVIDLIPEASGAVTGP